MKFKYKKIPVLLQDGSRSHVLRPIIPITLYWRKREIRYEVLLDSGADFSVFHSDIAKILNIDLSSGQTHTFGGVGSGGFVGYEHNVTLGIEGTIVTTEVVFSNDITDSGYGILGQLGFFEFFRVYFIYSKGQIDIKPEIITTVI